MLGMEDSEDEAEEEAVKHAESVAVQTEECPMERGLAVREQLLAAAKQEILKLRVRTLEDMCYAVHPSTRIRASTVSQF